MTTPQRRAVAVVLGLAVVLGTVLLLTSGSGGRGDEQRLSVRGRAASAPTTIALPPVTTEAPETSGTTIPLVPLTTGVPVPDAVEPPPTTAAPTATRGTPRTTVAAGGSGAPATAPAGATTVTGAGAVLTRPADPGLRTVDKAKGCNSAHDPGWSVEKCGALRSGSTVLLWVVETKGKGRRTLVLKEQPNAKWAVVLAVKDDTGAAFSSVGVRGEDVSGDGQPELLFGFHRRGSEGRMSVDVVDASTSVVVHRELTKGSVRAAGGRLETWTAAEEGFDQVVISFAGGAWKASAPKRVAGGAVPPSMI